MTGLWFSTGTIADESASSPLMGRKVDPGLEPVPDAVPLFTLLAEALLAGVSMVDWVEDGPGFWIGVLVWVERYTINFPWTATPSDPFFSSRVSISAWSAQDLYS